MTGPIVVEMMSAEALLWRCLHGGPLTAASVDAPGPDGSVPFRSFRARNLRFLRSLAGTYGAFAVVARQGETIVGHLRFYPKAVRELAAPAIGLCLQQEVPSGPADDLGRMRLPPLAEIADKTLLVHCLMVAPDGPGGGSLRHRGIGRRMAQRLVEWAGANGWRAVEATAYAPVPIVYAISGQAGRNFWEALGFRLAGTRREPLLEEENDFVRVMREQAAALGLDPASIADVSTMRREL